MGTVTWRLAVVDEKSSYNEEQEVELDRREKPPRPVVVEKEGLLAIFASAHPDWLVELPVFEVAPGYGAVSVIVGLPE
jgi:hypothetical protein